MTDKTPANHVHRSLKDICKERELLAQKEGVKLTTNTTLQCRFMTATCPNI
jgi:hypothetical protein